LNEVEKPIESWKIENPFNELIAERDINDRKRMSQKV
jgi:hypothetical protein